MKKIVKLIFLLSFIFFGGGFLTVFSEFILYNGLGDIFTYKRPNHIEVLEETDEKKNHIIFYYSYSVNGKSYNSKQTIYADNISKYDFYESNIVYNTSFPSFSYVGKKELKHRKCYAEMVGLGFFLILYILIYRFADLDKWIGIYTRGEYKSSRKK